MEGRVMELSSVYHNELPKVHGFELNHPVWKLQSNKGNHVFAWFPFKGH